jgi:dolichol-phosphate mannosyltransferase
VAEAAGLEKRRLTLASWGDGLSWAQVAGQANTSGQTRPVAPSLRRLTIVVPTYREAENLPLLIDRVAQVRQAHGLDIDLLVMDDDSRDGSVEKIAARPEPWVKLIVRTKERGLSAAVLEGLRQAEGEVLVCMDADLSHPPEVLPQLLHKLEDGADFVIGSRYVAGGSTSHDWGFLRWLNSRIATLLARPFTAARDPMSGYFALRRSTFQAGRDLNPIGYKIGLELLVKCGCERAVEVPIQFEDRQFGQSKLTVWQQILYLKHLRRLYVFKFGVWSQLLRFLTVGALGTVVNLAVLTTLLHFGLPARPAVACAIFFSLCFNFLLDRRFSARTAPAPGWVRQLIRFGTASSVGAAVNFAGTLFALDRGARPQVAALAGIALGMVFNLLFNRYLLFRSSHIRPRKHQRGT